jgi:hypothetical protein
VSTHSLDASGARPLTSTTNDPARTSATVSAKEGDDCLGVFGGFTRVEIPVPQTPGAVRLEVRRRVDKKAKTDERGDYVRDENRQIIYEQVEIEDRILVIDTIVNVLGRTFPNDNGFVPTPHTSFRIVNLEKDPYRPYWITGETVADDPVDLGYGTS